MNACSFPEGTGQVNLQFLRRGSQRRAPHRTARPTASACRRCVWRATGRRRTSGTLA